MVRPTYIEIDLAAISHNVAAFSQLLAPSDVCTVVKADAYGHGDVPVAVASLEAGATTLAVALVEEGVRLREAGIEAPILLLSEPPVESAVDVSRWDLMPTVYSQHFLDALADTGASFDVHVKVDTGMHRVGASPERLSELVSSIQTTRTLKLGSVWTHFAVADEDREFTRLQIDRFDEVVADVDAPTQHLCNTAGALLYSDARRDMCRIGLGTYGLHPSPETVGLVELKPAMRLVSHVSHVQRRAQGDRPSYGRARALPSDSRLVTVPVGYADGYARSLSKYGCALIGGKRFPLAGTVTMDQIVVDVGQEDIGVGEEVVLLGGQADSVITADDWAEQLGTISYEVVCSIGPRVPRRYV